MVVGVRKPRKDTGFAVRPEFKSQLTTCWASVSPVCLAGS